MKYKEHEQKESHPSIRERKIADDTNLKTFYIVYYIDYSILLTYKYI